MGEVFAALDQSTGTSVALKRLLASADARTTTALFMREYHALFELRHPCIIDVYDYGVDQQTPFYTMELLDGQDLRELSPAPFRDACRYLRDVASSLALLHARRLLHRDLSPRNVRRTSAGRCKLLDFGAMMPFGVPAQLIGTPPCIAPEVLQGGPLDQRADLYALGALAYYVLTGRYAHPVSEIAALPQAWKQAVQRPLRIVRDVPEALDDLVMALLSVDAMQRPASAAEVIDRLSVIATLPAQDDAATARSFLTGSQLLGREPQCQQLRAHVSKTLSGSGAAVLVQGESGMGRSRLLAEAAVIGQTSGLTVVRSVARTRGAHASLAADIVQGLLRAAPLEAQRAQRPSVAAGSLTADSGEARVQLLSDLTAFVQEIARARPLLITVDDLERADELSSSLVTALAYQSSDCPLTVIASYDSQGEPPMLAHVPGLADRVSLQAIDPSETHLLAASLFGDVPNLGRVSDWLYSVAAGNPKLTLQLAEHLLRQGVVRYVAGTWVLPAEVTLALPPSAAEALLLRLGHVSAAARALAELLSVSRAGASAARILELSREPAAAIFGALDELVRADVLESAGDAYAFAQEAVRVSLLGTLGEARRQELHAAWAERLLAGRPDRAEQLEAGWHLTHTPDELRGADILARLAPQLVERRISMDVAVPALERALEIYTRHKRPLSQQLHLRSLLVMSSFLFDHRLAPRYADATLDALFPFTGLAAIERWSPRIGKRAAFVASLVWTFLRRLVLPSARRGPSVLTALIDYSRAAAGLLGLRALAIDVVGIREVVERMRTFEGSPHPALRLLYSLGTAIELHNRGRGAEIAPILQDVLSQLGERGEAPLHMNEAERTDLAGGALLLAGVNECYREQSQALAYADKLDQLGTPIATAAALRIRLVYHLLRGEIERTQHYRRLLDLSAIQSGTVWQIDWIAVPIEGLAGTTWSDLITMRRSLDALEKLAIEVPSFVNMRDTVRVSYHYRRGDYAAAVRFGEQYIAEHAPFSLIGWAATYAQTGLSQLELGNVERALEICKGAYQLLGAREREYVAYHSIVEAAYAVTLAASGEQARAEALFESLLERLRAAGEHTRVFLMHEYRVKVARLCGDRTALHDALHDMQEAALTSGNASAILLADALTTRRAHARSSPLPPPSEASDDMVVTAFLKREQSSQRRAQQALQLLGQYADRGEGYLFLVKHGALELAASLDQRTPPSGLSGLLSTLVANEQRVTLATRAMPW